MAHPQFPIPCREAGLWRADSADYYAVRGGRYLAYTNDVVAFVEGLAEGAEKKGGSMPPFHRHMAGMAYQQALFRWVMNPLFKPFV